MLYPSILWAKWSSLCWSDHYDTDVYNPEAPSITNTSRQIFRHRVNAQRPNLIGLTMGEVDQPHRGILNHSNFEKTVLSYICISSTAIRSVSLDLYSPFMSHMCWSQKLTCQCLFQQTRFPTTVWELSWNLIRGRDPLPLMMEGCLPRNLGLTSKKHFVLVCIFSIVCNNSTCKEGYNLTHVNWLIFSSLLRINFNKPNHQGSHKRAQFPPNAKLLVRQIPPELNNISKLNEHFSKFGTIVNLQVSSRIWKSRLWSSLVVNMCNHSIAQSYMLFSWWLMCEQYACIDLVLKG